MKKSFRKNALQIRANIPTDQRTLKSQKISKQVLSLPQTIKARTISVYVDFRSEVETRKLIQSLLDSGKIVALPVVHYDTWELKFVAISSLDCLIQTPKHIWEPAPGFGQEIPIQDLDLILLPGAAFDYRGNRLGYGGGFYDRVLSQRRSDTAAVGLAFTEQLVDAVPTEEKDEKVDAIVTDIGVIHILP